MVEQCGEIVGHEDDVWIGDCYPSGCGVDTNYEKALNGTGKVLALGSTTAMVDIGHCYDYGKGIRRNQHPALEKIDDGLSMCGCLDRLNH